jgi:DNA gyrase subunit A
MTIGNVKTVDIDQEMQVAYLDYAMSVIVARALPDVRDGLKPVHRRILYAMHDLGLTHDKPYRKSARIVGEVLGKYHPHGDAAVYESMVRMAQDFSLRYPLVDGQGNFGSIDGDNAAAMRYTEARLAPIARAVLDDINKDTVEFGPNFDESLREPAILPALLPNLLVNGASGIAVGMATNIPPHNLGEVCDALCYLIDHYHRTDDVTINDLLQFIKGPDFPTGGLVFRYSRSGSGEEDDLIAQSYAVGRGRYVVQAKAHMEEMSRSRNRIVVTELPYQTNKTRLLERIAELAREGRIEGISDLRDESDRTGMRVVIELTRTADPHAVLADLFKLTPMQQTFGVSLLALVDGEPRLLSLKKMLLYYIEHRREIIRRRSAFDLARARARAHIVEGLLIALNNLDEVIAIIRRSRTTETARQNLEKRFNLTEIQAQAILDMPLKRLAQLERKKLEDEYRDLLRLIAELEALLASDKKMLQLIQQELNELKATYGDARRTLIVDRQGGTLTAHDLLPDQDVWVTVGSEGPCTRRRLETISATSLAEVAPSADIALLRSNTRQWLALLTRDGRAVRVGIHQLSETNGHWADLAGFTRRDRLVAAVALPRHPPADSNLHLVMVTRGGKAKRVTLADFVEGVNTEPTLVFNVDDKDELGWAWLAEPAQDTVLLTRRGQAIRFKQDEVRAMGLPAGGVNAVRLGAKDQVIAAMAAELGAELLTITDRGFAKRSALADFPVQGRAGGGVQAHSLNARTGLLALAASVTGQTWAAVLATAGGVRMLRAADAPLANRAAQGKAVVDVGSSTLRTLVTWSSPFTEEVTPAKAAAPAPRKPAPAPGGSRRATPAAATAVKAKATAPAPAGKAKAAAAAPAKSATGGRTSSGKPAAAAAPAAPAQPPEPTAAPRPAPASRAAQAAAAEQVAKPAEQPAITAARAPGKAKPTRAPGDTGPAHATGPARTVEQAAAAQTAAAVSRKPASARKPAAAPPAPEPAPAPAEAPAAPAGKARRSAATRSAATPEPVSPPPSASTPAKGGKSTRPAPSSAAQAPAAVPESSPVKQPRQKKGAAAQVPAESAPPAKSSSRATATPSTATAPPTAKVTPRPATAAPPPTSSQPAAKAGRSSARPAADSTTVTQPPLLPAELPPPAAAPPKIVTKTKPSARRPAT